jgi:hypothetical protein
MRRSAFPVTGAGARRHSAAAIGPCVRHRASRLTALIVVAASLAGCASQPTFPTGDPFAASPATPPATLTATAIDPKRVQTLTQDGVTVELAVATDEEASRQFGVSLAEYGIQPIWVRISNTTEVDYWLMPLAIDPDYYTADEAALVATEDLGGEKKAQVTAILRQHAMPFYLGGPSESEGYVYATYRRGGRFVDVRLSAFGHGVRMRFAVPLPTEGFDYELSPLRQLYAQVDSYPDLTRDEVRTRVREMPCCTTTADGKGEGDPLNIVLVGRGRDVLASLTAGGWGFTEAITADSIRRMIGAALTDQAMATAPVSALYAFGRKQDVALQRSRSKIAQRNHMRLWLAPFRCEGQPVWVGQVSRDIGVKLTRKSPTLTTHIIDPNVDESREYVLESLLHEEAVEWFAFVRGGHPATRDDPRHNLTDDPYFTDGMRMLIRVSAEPVPPSQTVVLPWNESTDPIRAGRGEDSVVHKDPP